MRRALATFIAALVGIGALTGGLAWLLNDERPAPAASRAERQFLGLCAGCHGADGRGSWRALLFLVRPPDLTDPGRLARQSDQLLFDVIKHGGAPIGRPGMPAFGAQLDDDDIRGLVAYVRALGQRRGRRSATMTRPEWAPISPSARVPVAPQVRGEPARTQVVARHDPLAAAALVHDAGRSTVSRAERDGEQTDCERAAGHARDEVAGHEEKVHDHGTHAVSK